MKDMIMRDESDLYIPKLMDLKAVVRELGLPQTNQNVERIRRLIHKHHVRHFKLGNSIALTKGQLVYLLRQIKCSGYEDEVTHDTGRSQGSCRSRQPNRSGSVSLRDVLNEKTPQHMQRSGKRKY